MTDAGHGRSAAGRDAAPLRRADLQLFLNAAGRVGRVTFVAAMAPTVVMLRLPAAFPSGWPQTLAMVLLWPTAGVVACVLTAKRLHDTGLAGWWTALLVALIAITLGSAPGETILGSGAAWILVVSLGLLVAWPGDPDFNRFGPVAEGMRVR